MKHFVLGIDGGGTKTHALIVNEEGRVQGWGIGGPSNYDDVGMEKAKAGVEEAVQVARCRARKLLTCVHLSRIPHSK